MGKFALNKESSQERISGKVYLIGENHNTSDSRWSSELDFLKNKFGEDVRVFGEYDLISDDVNKYGNRLKADCSYNKWIFDSGMVMLDLMQDIIDVKSELQTDDGNEDDLISQDYIDYRCDQLEEIVTRLESMGIQHKLNENTPEDNFAKHHQVQDPDTINVLVKKHLGEDSALRESIGFLRGFNGKDCRMFVWEGELEAIIESLHEVHQEVIGRAYELNVENIAAEMRTATEIRDSRMVDVAADLASKGEQIVWKIGDKHVERILANKDKYEGKLESVEIFSNEDFEKMLYDMDLTTAQELSTSASQFVSKEQFLGVENIGYLEVNELNYEQPLRGDVIIIGEDHDQTDQQEELEAAYFESNYKDFAVYSEAEFPFGIVNKYGNQTMGDPIVPRVRYLLTDSIMILQQQAVMIEENEGIFDFESFQDFEVNMKQLKDVFESNFTQPLSELSLSPEELEIYGRYQAENPEQLIDLRDKYGSSVLASLAQLSEQITHEGHVDAKMKVLEELISTLGAMDMELAGYKYNLNRHLQDEWKYTYTEREQGMIAAANRAAEQGKNVIWKIGENHATNIADQWGPHRNSMKKFTHIKREDFQKELDLFAEKRRSMTTNVGKIKEMNFSDLRSAEFSLSVANTIAEQVAEIEKKEIKVQIESPDKLNVNSVKQEVQPVVRLKSSAPVPIPVPQLSKMSTPVGVEAQAIVAPVVRLKSSAPAPIPVPQLSAISKPTAIDDQTLVENKEAKVQVRESNSSKQKELIGENDSKISTHTVASLTSATSAALKPTLSEEKVAEIRAILSAPVTNVKSEALSKSSVVSVPKKLIESGNPKSIELRLVDLVREIRKATIVKMPQMYQKYKLLSDFSVQLSKSEQKALSDKIVKARNEMIFAVEKQYSINVIGRNKEQKKGNKAIDAKKNELEKELAKKQQIRTDLLEKAGDALELRSSEIKLQKQQLKADHGISEASDAKLKIAIDNSKGSKKGVVVKKSVDDVRNRKVDSDILAAAKNAMERRKKEDEKKKDKAIKKDIEKLFKEADRDRFWGDTGASATVEKMIENMVQKRFLGGATTKMDTALAKEIMKHMDTSDYMNKFEQEYGNKMEDVMDRRMDDYVSSSSMNSYMDQMADSYISYLDSKRMDDELSARFDSHMNSYLEDRWNAINDYMDERMQERCDEIGRFLSEHNESMNQALENRYNSIFGSASMDTSRALLPGLMNS